MPPVPARPGGRSGSLRHGMTHWRRGRRVRAASVAVAVVVVVAAAAAAALGVDLGEPEPAAGGGPERHTAEVIRETLVDYLDVPGEVGYGDQQALRYLAPPDAAPPDALSPEPTPSAASPGPPATPAPAAPPPPSATLRRPPPPPAARLRPAGHSGSGTWPAATCSCTPADRGAGRGGRPRPRTRRPADPRRRPLACLDALSQPQPPLPPHRRSTATRTPVPSCSLIGGSARAPP